MAKQPKRKTRGLTPNQKEWNKIVKGTKDFMRRASKRGFIFDDITILDRPKQVTKKKLEQLKKQVNRKVLYSKAHYIDPTSGEYTTGTIGRKLERKRSAKKAVRTRVLNEGIKYTDYINAIDDIDESFDRNEPVDVSVIERILGLISALPDSKFYKRGGYYDLESRKNSLIAIIEERKLIAEENDSLAEYVGYLESRVGEIVQEIEVVMYNSAQEQVYASFIKIARILEGKTVMSLKELQEVEEMGEYFSSGWGEEI